jgi:hypothetical protein
VTFVGGVILGVALLIIDWTTGLPLYWRIIEGPFVIVLGLILLCFSRPAPLDVSGRC